MEYSVFWFFEEKFEENYNLHWLLPLFKSKNKNLFTHTHTGREILYIPSFGGCNVFSLVCVCGFWCKYVFAVCVFTIYKIMHNIFFCFDRTENKVLFNMFDLCVCVPKKMHVFNACSKQTNTKIDHIIIITLLVWFGLAIIDYIYDRNEMKRMKRKP